MPRANFVYPEVGSYITFSINASQTVTRLGIQDPRGDLYNLQTTTHVGFVETREILDDASCKLTIRIALTSSYLKSSSTWKISPSMSVAVLPNTSHPFGRVLQPDRLLPWSDAYHSSFLTVQVYCLPNINPIISEPICWLNMVECTRLSVFRGEDQLHNDTLLSSRPISGVQRAFQQPPRRHSRGYSSGDHRTGLPYEESLRYQDNFATMVVDFSYDLSKVGALPNPREFFEDAENLNIYIVKQFHWLAPHVFSSPESDASSMVQEYSTIEEASCYTPSMRTSYYQPEVDQILWRSHANTLKITFETISHGFKRFLGWKTFKPKASTGIMHMAERDDDATGVIPLPPLSSPSLALTTFSSY